MFILIKQSYIFNFILLILYFINEYFRFLYYKKIVFIELFYFTKILQKKSYSQKNYILSRIIGFNLFKTILL